jgi:hypothetical protein
MLIFIICGDGGCGRVPEESRSPHTPLLLICCSLLPLHLLRLGRHTLSCTIFILFGPRWMAASLAAFLLHQTQSTTQSHPPSSLREPTPPCLSSSNSRHTLPLWSLSLPPHPVPMTGCCVLGGQGRTLSTSSLPLDHRVAIITLTSVICCLLFSLPEALPLPMSLSSLLPMVLPLPDHSSQR